MVERGVSRNQCLNVSERISVEAEVPVIYGVLTADTVEQAVDRAGAKQGNKGWEAALSALEMVGLYRRMSR